MKWSILLVEDESDLRAIIELLLQDTFEIFSAGTAQAAIRRIDSGAKIDLLLTDFNLLEGDRKDGLDVTLALRKRHPSVPVVLVSGAGVDSTPRIQELLALPGTLFLEKPFNSATLLKVIRKIELNIKEAALERREKTKAALI